MHSHICWSRRKGSELWAMISLLLRKQTGVWWTNHILRTFGLWVHVSAVQLCDHLQGFIVFCLYRYWCWPGKALMCVVAFSILPHSLSSPDTAPPPHAGVGMQHNQARNYVPLIPEICLERTQGLLSCGNPNPVDFKYLWEQLNKIIKPRSFLKCTIQRFRTNSHFLP